MYTMQVRREHRASVALLPQRLARGEHGLLLVAGLADRRAVVGLSADLALDLDEVVRARATDIVVGDRVAVGELVLLVVLRAEHLSVGLRLRTRLRLLDLFEEDETLGA